MKLHPDFNFLPKPDRRFDLTLFHETPPPTLSLKVKKDLVSMALKFRDLMPWKNLSDEDLFGIRDEESGALHLISVEISEEGGFSLHCHMQPSAEALRQGMETGAKTGTGDLCLLECQFVDPAQALKDDLALIGLLQRKGRLPAFRSYRPGYFPWFVDEDEAKTMISVFRLFFRFYEEIYPNRSEFYQWENPFGKMPGIPVFYLPDDSDPADASAWQVKMEVLPSECLAPPRPRPAMVEDLAELEDLEIREETWEIGSFFVPTPVFDGSRPFYPKSALCLRVVESGSHCPCDPIIYGGDESDTEVIRQAFRDVVDECEYLPSAIRADSEVSLSALEAYADEFDIELIYNSQQHLPGLMQEIVNSFEDKPLEWDEALLDKFVAAIPEEFRMQIDEQEDLDVAIEAISDKILKGNSFDVEVREEESPENVIFADFSSPRPTGSSLD